MFSDRLLYCQHCYYPFTMPLGLTLAPKVLASKTLTSWVTPVAHWYANLAGYRKYGLKYDDLGTCAHFFRILQCIDRSIYSHRGI